jgi:hypothetical protein
MMRSRVNGLISTKGGDGVMDQEMMLKNKKR